MPAPECMRPVSTASFNGLLIISAIAFMAPILAVSVRRVKLPSAVVEIVAGIIIGPSVLAWVKVDQPVAVVALLGLAFLLFLAGLEVDLRAMTPSQLRAPLTGYAGSLLLGSVAGVAFTRQDGSATRSSWPSRCQPPPSDSSSSCSPTPANPEPSSAS